jgi:hypothetical protein
MKNKPAQFICTKETPWSQILKGQFVIHPSAEEIRQEDGYPGGDLVTFKCPICKHIWTVELPQ